ncbi:ABC transporter ATP-binding protein [Marivita sp.]|uniref:ABC transporter ATP-binding protein n=2 Tax=Marivita sp. TaxID=2003365 RepID=UPI00321B1060
MSKTSTTSVLEVRDVEVEFRTSTGTARVLNRVSFSLQKGKTLGIVGESGSGKSMTALAILGLIPQPPGRIAGGRILFNGEDLLAASNDRLRQIRGNDISMIFQEPMTSLNPVFTVGEQISEVFRIHGKTDRAEARERAVEMLRAVGIPNPERRVKNYPHEMSGGMRQRVMIAMALACNPSVLIADEPTTALDVTVQAQIFDLIEDLQDSTETTVILITHDMGVIAEMAHRVAVMYAGRIVEEGTVEQILSTPRHPYTVGLIGCVPKTDPDSAEERAPLVEIPGVVPSLIELGLGCAFAPRCNIATDRCFSAVPPHFKVGDDHRAACWLADNGDGHDN